MSPTLPAAYPLQDLLGLASELGRSGGQAVHELAAALLAWPPGESFRRGRSGLNHDGSPLELCLSSFSDGCRVRMIVDPAATVVDPGERFAASLAAFDRALDMASARALEPLCRLTLGLTVPTQPELLSRYVEGVFWLGAGIGAPGLALYVDATKRDREEAWQRAASWLNRLLPAAEPAAMAVAALCEHADLMAYGLEGTAAENARAKLFWRLRRPLPLAALGLPQFEHPSLIRFLAAALADREIPLTGLVLSQSFLVATGQAFDAKADVCGHCLDLSARAWALLLEELTGAFGLAPLPAVEETLAGREVAAAFVGLNRNALGHHRLDFFLKPRAWLSD